MGVVNNQSYQEDNHNKAQSYAKYGTPADSNYQSVKTSSNYITDYRDKNYIRNHSTANLRGGANMYANSFQTESSVVKEGLRGYSASKGYADMSTPVSSGTDMKHLEKLKSKIRDLENKMGNFNKSKFMF
jgi:hypothetical protein